MRTVRSHSGWNWILNSAMCLLCAVASDRTTHKVCPLRNKTGVILREMDHCLRGPLAPKQKAKPKSATLSLCWGIWCKLKVAAGHSYHSSLVRKILYEYIICRNEYFKNQDFDTTLWNSQGSYDKYFFAVCNCVKRCVDLEQEQ